LPSVAATRPTLGSASDGTPFPPTKQWEFNTAGAWYAKWIGRSPTELQTQFAEENNTLTILNYQKSRDKIVSRLKPFEKLVHAAGMDATPFEWYVLDSNPDIPLEGFNLKDGRISSLGCYILKIPEIKYYDVQNTFLPKRENRTEIHSDKVEGIKGTSRMPGGAMNVVILSSTDLVVVEDSPKSIKWRQAYFGFAVQDLK
jgi:hypothetical protein